MINAVHLFWIRPRPVQVLQIYVFSAFICELPLSCLSYHPVNPDPPFHLRKTLKLLAFFLRSSLVAFVHHRQPYPEIVPTPCSLSTAISPS